MRAFSEFWLLVKVSEPWLHSVHTTVLRSAPFDRSETVLRRSLVFRRLPLVPQTVSDNLHLCGAFSRRISCSLLVSNRSRTVLGL